MRKRSKGRESVGNFLVYDFALDSAEGYFRELLDNLIYIENFDMVSMMDPEKQKRLKLRLVNIRKKANERMKEVSRLYSKLSNINFVRSKVRKIERYYNNIERRIDRLLSRLEV